MRMGMAALVPAVAVVWGVAAHAAPVSSQAVDAAALANWRGAMAALPLPANACFRADYPAMAFRRVACGKAPEIPFVPRHAAAGAGNTVGNGHDYAALSATPITQSVGSFPKVTGLTSEKDFGFSNAYTLQLNSNFFSGSPTCNGSSNPSACQAWEQFVFANQNSGGQVFMQYWLINYAATCPARWNSFGADCYVNSASVPAPAQAVTNLQTLSITASAQAGGIDKAILGVGTTMYVTTGEDKVVGLADGWTASEFNIIGDGGGSEAVFNTGTHLTVKIALTNGAMVAPVCEPDAGTTGETNNLNLGSCKAAVGPGPYIGFKESN